MELEELKNSIKNIKAPEIKYSSPNLPAHSPDDLITLLKKEDEKNRKTLKKLKNSFGIGSVIYFLIFILTWFFPPDSNPQLNRISLALSAIVFLCIVFFSFKKQSELAGIDYSEPVLSFLQKAAERYRLFNPKDLKMGIPFLSLVFLMLGFSWINGINRYLSSIDTTTAVISYILFSILLSSLGIYLNKANWKKNKAPILAEIQNILDGFSSDERNDPEKE